MRLWIRLTDARRNGGHTVALLAFLGELLALGRVLFDVGFGRLRGLGFRVRLVAVFVITIDHTGLGDTGQDEHHKDCEDEGLDH